MAKPVRISWYQTMSGPGMHPIRTERQGVIDTVLPRGSLLVRPDDDKGTLILMHDPRPRKRKLHR